MLDYIAKLKNEMIILTPMGPYWHHQPYHDKPKDKKVPIRTTS